MKTLTKKTKHLSTGNACVRRLASLGLLVMASCATGSAGTTGYVAQRLLITGTPAEHVALIQAYVRENGWSLASPQTRPDATVEAITPPVDLAGTLMRDRIYFLVSANAITIERRLEVMFDPTEAIWQSSDRVCATYEYRFERRIMDGLAARTAAKPKPESVAMGVAHSR